MHAELRSRGQRLPAPAAARLRPGRADDDTRDAAAACALLDELLGALRATPTRSSSTTVRAVDFDDLELRAGELLDERPASGGQCSERFELLMVDEFQDTNPASSGSCGRSSAGTCSRWGTSSSRSTASAHADVGLFRDRRSELAGCGRSLALTGNFRSVAPLLEVVNAVFAERFAGLHGRSGRAARADRSRPSRSSSCCSLQASGWEEDEELAEEIARGLPPAALWRQAEARLLAERVAELVESGSVRAGDVVLLLRAGGDLEVYERALQLRGMRTLAAVGGFWCHQQIGDLLAYLRALANPLDEQALYGTLASPLVGLSRDGLALLARAAAQAGRSVWETAWSPHQQGLLDELPAREKGGAARVLHSPSERARARLRAHALGADRARDRLERISRARARAGVG